jgi:hypothetical protein
VIPEHALLAEGFRGSPGYARWRDLLHHYYHPFPTVQHYTPVLDA